ncbi:hypothetical protein CLHUN_37770 [Ruminiclostridium hungatei]|uniref:Uncharacterized protein n=1 Tax=Ruminiclostridium hungatei TaxID=48256 RepID=A0A1V4SER3_RUMHU|nr:hypothetical protein CLHUN_37770 [Ruminiclostridium hungatei]
MYYGKIYEAALYNVTDSATIIERLELYNSDEIIYIVDKSQGPLLHLAMQICCL